MNIAPSLTRFAAGGSLRRLGSAPLRLKLVAALILPVLVVAGYLALRVDGAFDARQVAARQETEVARFTGVSALAQAISAEQANLVNATTGNDEMFASREATDSALAAVRGSGVDPVEQARIDALAAEIVEIRGIVGDDVNTFRLTAATDLASGNTADGSTVERALRLAEIAKWVSAGYDFDASAIADVETAQGLADIALIQEVRNNFASETATVLGLSAVGSESMTAEALEFYAEKQATTDSSIENLTSLSTAELGAGVQVYLDSEDYAQVTAVRTALDAVQPFGELPFGSLELVAIGNTIDAALSDQQAVETQQLFDNASTNASNANWDLVRSAGIGSALFALVVLILTALYRAIRNPLARLTDRSKEIADVELPEIVTAMRSGDLERVPSIEPLVAESNDEIGELVEAFNGMHRTAIELAGEQAASRRVVADMFVNLGRRNQRLLNRMLKGLTALERTEQDPDALGALYDIDHLATRMRRNAESLLILAGASQARRLKNPVGAYDVVRAALAEVEGYDRVQIEATADVLVHGDYVADLTHLLAELIENALSFSPPTSQVAVVTRPTHKGFVIAISDEGLGMSPDLIEMANDRIRSAANEDETPSEFLGHYVVGRLASRHGIDVDLLDGVAGGLTARVILPAKAVVTVSAEADAPADDRQGALAPLSDEAPSNGTRLHVRSENALEWDSIEAGSSERPLAAPTPHLPLPEQIVVPPSPASLDGIETEALIEPDVPTADRPTLEVPAALDDAISDESKSAVADVAASVGAAADTDLTVFGSKRRSPGSNLPVSTIVTPEPAAAENPLDFTRTVKTTTATNITDSAAAAVEADEPDAVRSSLSGFQSGTARADRED